MSPKATAIAHVMVRPYSFRMSRVVRTARGAFVDRAGWHVTVTAADKFVGVGDAACWPGFGTDTQSCASALHTLAQAYAHRAWPEAQALAQALSELPVEVAHALSSALLDIEAQRLGLPLAQHLNAKASDKVLVHALVDNAQDAQAKVKEGYKTIKVKVGIEPIDDEVTRIVALRAAIGPDIGLRLDANGAWPVPVALRAARLLAMVSPEWLEQPVAADDVAGMAHVRQLGGVPIAADESVMTRSDVDTIVAHNAADIIVIKPMYAGGLQKAVALGQAAQAAGLEVIVTHALESAQGRLAALHTALALGCTRACGLGGALPEADASWQLPAVRAGVMQPFAAPGLGFQSRPFAGGAA